MRFYAGTARVALMLAIIGTSPAVAQEGTLNIGDRAPIFEGRSDEGTIWKSREHVGRSMVVVYFYPGAMTAGCTTQACLFRDNRSELQALGAEVIGISGDRIEGLKAFKALNQLNFPLVSDTAGVIARAFGVPMRDGASMEREVDGEVVTVTRDVTLARWTFIIDREGRIVFKETEVDPAGDSARVIAHLRGMAAAN